jgi:hypothetical protein
MKRVAWSGLLILVAVTAYEPAFAETQSEHVNWGHWSFNWEVRDNTGLALRDVTYADEPVLAKASMPVIRVKYVKRDGLVESLYLVWVACREWAVWPFPGSSALAGSRADRELQQSESLHRKRYSE